MALFYQLVKADYVQRTRSYGFLVTLLLSLLVSYYFVPNPDAGYSTLRIGSYVGNYNTAWVGHVIALMSSIFVSMIGFYLINNSIKRDITTGVGVITATTRLSNFKYLLSKAISNVLVLLSIIGMVMFMALILSIVRGGNYPFDITQLILPFLLVTLPCMVMVAIAAVVAEIIFRKKQILQNIAYFIFFCFVLASLDKTDSFDLFGHKYVINEITGIVHTTVDPNTQGFSIGFIIQNNYKKETFAFEGISWSTEFIMSRVYMMSVGVFLLFLLSFVFHRFNVKEKSGFKKIAEPLPITQSSETVISSNTSSLPVITKNYSIIPLITTEITMLVKKGPRWIWFANLGLFIALLFADITTAHMIVLPLLWALQINRWSDLFTKDETAMVHYFTYSSYRPVKRLLTAQIIAAVIMALAFALPLVLRYSIIGNISGVLGIIIGAMMLTAFSMFLGILSGSSKIFEVVLLFCTYALIQKIPFADYLGSIDQTIVTRLWLFVAVTLLLAIGYGIRSYKIQHV